MVGRKLKTKKKINIIKPRLIIKEKNRNELKTKKSPSTTAAGKGLVAAAAAAAADVENKKNDHITDSGLRGTNKLIANKNDTPESPNNDNKLAPKQIALNESIIQQKQQPQQEENLTTKAIENQNKSLKLIGTKNDRIKNWLLSQKNLRYPIDNTILDVNNVGGAGGASTTDKEELTMKPVIKGTISQVDISQQPHLHDKIKKTKVNRTKNSPNKSRRVKKIIDNLKIAFICEWKHCSFESYAYMDLQNHLKIHIDMTVTTTIDNLEPHTNLLTKIDNDGVKVYEIEDETNNNNNNANNENNENKICDVFKCDWDLCLYNTRYSKIFERHVYYHGYHTKIKTFGECALSRKRIVPCELDSKQRNNIPELPSDFICQWEHCTYRFNIIHEYFEHLRTHCSFEFSVRRPKERHIPVKCGWIGCTLKFQKLSKIYEHIATHSNQKLIGCPQCGSTFSTHLKFYDHSIRQSCNNTQEYQCELCLKLFSTERLLKNHMYKHVNSLKCTICEMTCSSPSGLATHIRYKHIDERPYACTQCDIRTVTKNDLTKHINSIHNNIEYKCTETACEFICKHLKTIQKHLREVHGDGPAYYACHCCEKRYKVATNLSQHLIKIHGYQLPESHTRFSYRQDADGLYRLQTMRMESLEVSKQIVSPSFAEMSNKTNVKYSLSDIKTMENGCVSIQLTLKNPNDMVNKKRIRDDAADADDEDDGTDADEPENGYENEDEVMDYESEVNEHDEYDEENDSSEDTEDGDDGDVLTDDEPDNDNTKIKNNTKIKSINNFSVMKRFLKNDKQKPKILITVKDIDNAGNVVNTEIVKAKEYHRVKLPTKEVNKVDLRKTIKNNPRNSKKKIQIKKK